MKAKIRSDINILNNYVRDNKETSKVLSEAGVIGVVDKTDVKPNFNMRSVVDTKGRSGGLITPVDGELLPPKL